MLAKPRAAVSGFTSAAKVVTPATPDAVFIHPHKKKSLILVKGSQDISSITNSEAHSMEWCQGLSHQYPIPGPRHLRVIGDLDPLVNAARERDEGEGQNGRNSENWIGTYLPRQRKG